jgi:hypothetical protein
MPPSAIQVAGLAGDLSFGGGADGTQADGEGAEPGQPQLLPDVVGRPSGLGRVGVARQPQPPCQEWSGPRGGPLDGGRPSTHG